MPTPLVRRREDPTMETKATVWIEVENSNWTEEDLKEAIEQLDIPKDLWRKTEEGYEVCEQLDHLMQGARLLESGMNSRLDFRQIITWAISHIKTPPDKTQLIELHAWTPSKKKD